VSRGGVAADRVPLRTGTDVVNMREKFQGMGGAGGAQMCRKEIKIQDRESRKEIKKQVPSSNFDVLPKRLGDGQDIGEDETSTEFGNDGACVDTVEDMF